MVDDERRALALEVLDGEPQILEVHAIAVQVDGRVARLHPQQPERHAEPHDPTVGGIEGQDVELFGDRGVRRAPGGRCSRAGICRCLSSSMSGRLTGESRRDGVELLRPPTPGVAAFVSMCCEM